MKPVTQKQVKMLKIKAQDLGCTVNLPSPEPTDEQREEAKGIASAWGDGAWLQGVECPEKALEAVARRVAIAAALTSMGGSSKSAGLAIDYAKLVENRRNMTTSAKVEGFMSRLNAGLREPLTCTLTSKGVEPVSPPQGALPPVNTPQGQVAALLQMPPVASVAGKSRDELLHAMSCAGMSLAQIQGVLASMGL